MADDVLTLADLILEVNQFFGEAREDVDDNRIIRALNLAQNYLAQKYDLPEMEYKEKGIFTITSDMDADSVVPFSSLLNKPRLVYSIRVFEGSNNARNAKLRAMHPRTFDRMYPDATWGSRDLPSVVVQWANSFEFRAPPRTGDTFAIRGLKWPVPFSSSNLAMVSDFGEKNLLLILWAVQHIYNGLGEYDRSNKFYSMFRSNALDMQIDQKALDPDEEFTAPGASGGSSSNYWADPFVRETP